MDWRWRCAFVLLFALAQLAATPRQAPRKKPAQHRAPASKPSDTPAASTPAAADAASDAIGMIQLPSPCTEFHAADGGRKIVFYFRPQRKLIIGDVIAQKLVGEIPVPADDARLACTRDRILLALPEQKLIQSYDLTSLKRLKSARLPDERPLRTIRAGCTSAGPAYLWFGGELVALDVEKLTPIKLEGKVPGGGIEDEFHYRVSADGTTVTAYQTSSSPADYQVMRIRGNVATIVKGPQAFSMANRTFTPTADGSFILYGGSVYDRDTHDVPADNLKDYTATVPTTDPRYFLAVRQLEEGRGGDVAICATNDRQILGVIRGVRGIASSAGYENERWGSVEVGKPGGGEPRLILLPDAELLAVVRESDDVVEVRRVSFNSLVGAPGAAGLAVVSLPPAEVEVGKPLSYTIETIPLRAASKCKLESGPEGMSVSPAGKVTWTPKDRPIGGKTDVIVSVADEAGHEVMHSFSLEVTRGGSAPPTVTETKPEAKAQAWADAKAQAKTGAAPKAAPAPVAPSKIVKADEHRIELPSGNFRYVPGYDGKSTLLLCGNQLAVLAADGFTIKQINTLAKSYVAIAQRERYYVAIANSPATIDILDKNTLKATRSRVLPAGDLCDLVLHPLRPIAYVAQVGKGKPHSKFIIVDESNVEAREDARWVGEWLAIAPSGEFLVAGYHDIYQEGHDIIDNPDNIWIVPKYGSIDSLIRYDLREDGIPSGAAEKEDAGGNGTGIRLSADGKRVTYLSHVGSPRFSSNLSGWDPQDLSKVPVAYGTKDRASTQDAAFHPSLPLLASPGKGAVVIFDRESGAVQEDRARLEDLRSAAIEHVMFSPDGRQLIADTVVNGIHYLYHTPLKLSDEEVKQLDRPAAVAPPPLNRQKNSGRPAQRV